MLVITATILFPLLLLRKMDSLQFTSMGALVGICYLVGLVIAKSAYQGFNAGIQYDHVVLANFSSEIFIVLPIISFAYTFHMNIFSIVNEMKEPNRYKTR
jgi:amino acid permease